MSTTPISGSLDSISTSTPSDKARKGLADNFDNFLVLLTTQLKNQDPTSPLDTNQFTQQLVAFSQVEQSVNTNTNLEKLIAMNQSSQVNSAVSYLGKIVETEGNSFTLANSNGEFFYKLDDAAAETFVTVTDTLGRTVFTTKGEITAGKHSYSWNGKDQAGNPVKDGTYKVRVSALDREGQDVAVTTSVTNVVTGVSTENGQPMLTMGDNEDITAALDKVLSVRFKDYF